MSTPETTDAQGSGKTRERFTRGLTLTQQRRASEAMPEAKKRIPATIWQSENASIGHESPWNVEINAPGWGNDFEFETPGFATCDEAYQYIHEWACGRGVACTVDFGYLAGVEL